MWSTVQGILYVLRKNISWQLPSLELRFGAHQNCWRQLERWPLRPCEPSSGPGHGTAVTGARGSATAEGADRR
ncbi:hypothetical protein [Streptomyces sp. NPDC023838]|uniref:hypothetical protein n=1 Tax=Streptomyces sp. NPDC023838 TaxID=3154325 RepID=UPI0033F0BC99